MEQSEGKKKDSVEFSESDGVLFGKVQGIRSLISYEGTSVQELLDDFHGAVDDYLALCEEEGQVRGCPLGLQGQLQTGEGIVPFQRYEEHLEVTPAQAEREASHHPSRRS